MKNSVSNIAKMISISIIILGLFGSIALAIKYGENYTITSDGITTARNIEKTIIISLVGMIITIIVGIIIYCLGEIIQKLQNIEFLTNNKSNNMHVDIQNFDSFVETLSDDEKALIVKQFKK